MNFFGHPIRADVLRARRLSFEYLERRDLLTMIRLVDWNTFNNPNDAADEANFETILAAIGNEDIAGNTQRLDVLAVQETDPDIPAANNSIGKVEAILDNLYPSTDYASVASTVDGGGDSTGFVYDTSTVSLLESTEILPGSVTHKILRGKFRPESTLGESDFYVYSIHLKSGDSNQEEDARASEALALRADADSLGEGAHVLFVGDFNMHSSSDGAYTNLVAAGAAHLQDLAGPGAIGNWLDNPDFVHLHTQDARVGFSGMDDRFDIMFGTDEFFDGTGLEFVDDSFHVFGNDGSHMLNGDITTGSGADPAVLTALAEASDHLPIVAEFEIVSGPGVRIVETGGVTKVAEGGFFDMYNVVLNTIPSADVTVTLTPNAQLDLGNGPGVAKALVFTVANALTPQPVVVNATDDLLLEGTHSGLVMHTATSADSEYNGLTIEELIVTILDDDAPVIVINEVDSDSLGSDTAEFVELYDGGVGNVSLNGMTLVFFNGNTDVAYRVIPLDGQVTDANGFFLAANEGVAGADITFINGGLQNGPDAVALYSGTFSNGDPVTTTNLVDAVVYRTDTAEDPELQVLLAAGELQVNENQNELGDSQSLSRLPDGGAPRETSTYVAQAPTPGGPNLPTTPGVVVTQSGAGVDLAEGGATDNYQIALQTTPSADVTITIDPDDQTDLGAGAGIAIVLTFTTANALIPQAVIVAAVDDMDIEGTHTSLITHTAASADSGYNSFVIPNVTANITDNDFGPPTPFVITEIMYNPASDESVPGLGEWIEIVNTGVTAVDLEGWLFDDEDSTNWGPIPAGTTLNPNQMAVFFDTAFTTAAAFRAEWGVPASALVVGIEWGSLGNTPAPGNEVLKLLDDSATLMDIVNYDDEAPWPADSVNGPSFYLKNLSLDNNTGGSWTRSMVGVRNAASPTGPTFNTADVGTPEWQPLSGDYNSNGLVDAADYTVWRDTLGSTTDARADGSGSIAGVPDGVVDSLDYDFWKSNFGQELLLGSGGGHDGGSGQIVAAAEVHAASQTISAVVENDLAVDAALIEWGSGSTGLRTATESKPTFRRLMANAPDDLLLIVELRRSTDDQERDIQNESPGTSDGDFDDYFASLDERELVAGAALD